MLHDLAAIVNREFSVDDAARVLLSTVPRVLDVDGAGISVVDERGAMRFVQATTEAAEQMERIQEAHQVGPCQDARHGGLPVVAVDIPAADHWPREYRDRARALGLRTVTTFPLQARGRVWGALDLYRSGLAPLSEDDVATGQALAQVATGYLVLAADRDALRRAQSEISRRAMYDSLTELPLRWVLVDHVERALSALGRTPGHVGVLFVDLDGLKYVNDTHGHAAGDHLIRTSADALRSTVRPTDVVARVGGDEFVVLLPGLAAPGAAEEIAGRVLDALTVAARDVDSSMTRRTASVGVVTTDDPTAFPDTLISHADAAMYQAKRAGGGRHAVFDPATYAAATGRQQLQDELSRALRGDELELHYQPIVRLEDGGVHGVEALLRWRHPSRGLLSAGALIGAVEGTDLMQDVGAWVLRAACRQLAAWDAEASVAAPGRVFVNLSAGELAHPAVGSRVRSALEESGLDGARLVLEVTETEAITQPRAAAMLGALRDELGCGVAIDDFGTGHSSLSRLVQLPADIIKIDRSFTSRLFTSRDARPVVSAMVHLGATLGRELVIEGIEDASSHAALIELGCRYGQGYHLARPQSASELAGALGRALGRG